MPRPHRLSSPILRYAYRRYVGTDPARWAAFEQELINAEVAMALYRLRTEAGLTQAALARKVGTAASVISRLEDADYRGHSLPMLRRITEALGWRMELRFVPLDGRTTRAGRPRRPAA